MKNKPSKRIFSFILMAALVFGGIFAAPPQTAYAAMPASTVGAVWDGLDFAALAAGNGIYYGAYKHATSWESTVSNGAATHETAQTPVLWRVMGEEASEGAATLMSEYVLDSCQFSTSQYGGDAQNYATSELREWLNNDFLNSFTAAENDGMKSVSTTTDMYDSSDGNLITGDHYPEDAYDDAGNHIVNSPTNMELNNGPWPKTTAGDKVYIPWGEASSTSVYWTAGNGTSEGPLSSRAATLKGGGGNIAWWLRSPFYLRAYDAFVVHWISSNPSPYVVTHFFGVRPAFKLDPKSVIITSEIKANPDPAKGETQANADYVDAATPGTKNFKLTVVNSSLSLSGLWFGGNSVSSSTRLPAELGGAVALTGAGPAGTKLTYKIVANSGGVRKIVGYGQSADNTSLTVNAKDLDGADLVDGYYTVYVWAQKDNQLNSHEGSVPRYFTLAVGTPPAYSFSYAPMNIETIRQPNLPKTETLSYPGTVENSRLTFTITKDMVQDALDKAGEDPNGIGLIFDIAGSGFTAQTVTFEDAAIDLLKSSGVKLVQVQTGMFRFKFDDKAIAQLDAQTTGPVSVNANPAKLSTEAKKLIGNRPAFDVRVQFKKGGETWNVVNFGSGRMTRWIAYKLAPDESAENLAAVYVDKNGRASWIDNSSYKDGWLGWTGNTCSVYGAGYKTPAPAFADTANHWAKDSISFAVSRGYMSGTSDTAFAPDAATTRGMLVTALGRLSGADVSAYKTSSFNDVAAYSYYMPYIEWAVKNKIVSGVGGGRFAPENPIAREDMAVIMANFAKASNYTLPIALEAFKFTDAQSISSHAKEAVVALQQAGIVAGKNGGVFDPRGYFTRAEAAMVLRRFVETVIDPVGARGWVQNDSGGRLYYGPVSGKLITGWQYIGGDRYYFDAIGIMQAGKWVWIDGARYYFYPDGRLAVNTTIDDYEVGADGARK